MMNDYYDILGVSKDASENDIKKAFRKLAKENHPDKHPGDKNIEEKFKKINEAYSVLSDKDKRAKYDNRGNEGFRTHFSGNVNPNDINDIFSKFFNGGFGPSDDMFSNSFRNNERENLNLVLGLSISFEESYCGCEKRISFNSNELCDKCNGSGFDKSSRTVKCDKCNGSGFIYEFQRGLFGNAQRVKVKCSKCNGSGVMYERKCSKCRGEGRLDENKRITVKIPKGTYPGMDLKIKGVGKISKTGIRGDVFLRINTPMESSDGLFKRINSFDIEYNLYLTYYELVCGCVKDIRLPSGEVKSLKIPKNRAPESMIKMKGFGFKILTGGLNSQENGDLFIRIKLKPIDKLTKEQEELLKQFNSFLN